MTCKKIRWDTFVKKYKPVKNTIVKEAPFDGYMFETYGEELTELKNKAEASAVDGKNGYHVWTIIDDNGPYVENGWNYANRLGYIFTEEAWEEGDDIISSV